MIRAPLVAGDRAWCIVRSLPTKGGRCSVEGAAEIEIVQVIGGIHRCRVTRGSGVRAGVVLELLRAELFARSSREEHAAFGEEVRRYWGDAWRGEGNPRRVQR